MKNFKISEKQGYNYSLESGDQNKIHLDELTGYNSIYNHKIVHGTLIFLKFIKELNLKKLNKFTLEIKFKKGFKYNISTQISKNRIFQKNAGDASINFLKEEIKFKYKNEKFKLVKTIKSQYINTKKNLSHKNIRTILNHLTWYVGMIYPGDLSIISDINLIYSSNFIKSKYIYIYSKKTPGYPVIKNKIYYENFIAEFTTLIRPKLNFKKTKINKVVKQSVLNTKIPILILGAGSGIGKEILEIFKYNKKIKIISTYNKNKILLNQLNIKILQIEEVNIKQKLIKIINQLDQLRIYYFISPKILLSNNNLNNIKKYKKFYIDVPKKIISLIPNNFYLEFFYPSTVFIDQKTNNDYTNSKIIAENILKKLNKPNIKINILRIDKINTKQNLSLISQKLPTFTSKLNNDIKYREKVFFLKS